jgi:uncharacterized surface protein with fasciclin (FAS1) repeats
MRIRKTVAAAAAATVALAGVALATPAGAIGGPGTDTIAEALAERSGGVDNLDTNPFDYDLLIRSALASSLAGAVTNPSTTVTLFAPNDLAFRQLLTDLTGQSRWLSAPETQVRDRLVQIFTANPGLLDTVLKYHVVSAAQFPVNTNGRPTIEAAEVLAVGDGLNVPTLAGADFQVDVQNTRLPLVILQDKDRDDLDPVLAQTRLDIIAGTSTIHGVTQVLRPADVGKIFEFRGPNLPVAIP